MEWKAGEITKVAIRPVSSSGDRGAVDGVKGGVPCQVLSRTRLVVDGGELHSNEGVFEGGSYWYSTNVGALKLGDEARLVASPRS